MSTKTKAARKETANLMALPSHRSFRVELWRHLSRGYAYALRDPFFASTWSRHSFAPRLSWGSVHKAQRRMPRFGELGALWRGSRT